jgi:hypothetical protein
MRDPRDVHSIESVLIRAGIEFIEENGGDPAVA